MQPLNRPVDWTGRVVAAVLFAWIVLVPLMVQGASWFVQQLSSGGVGGGLTDPDFVATLVQALLLLVPLAPLALFWKQPRYRLIFRVWFFAALFNLLATVIHLPDATAAFASSGLQIAVSLLFALLLSILWRRKSNPNLARRKAGSFAISLAIAPILLLPWAGAGALGTPMEAILNLLASILFGLCAALLLRPLALLGEGGTVLDKRLRVLGGFVVGAALTPMASSYAFGGVQLLAAISVPAVAWIAMSLIGRRPSTLALMTLIGVSMAGPLLFVDPREMALSLSFGLFSTLSLAFRMAFVSLSVAWVVGLIILAVQWLGRAQTGVEVSAPARLAWRWLFVAAPAWILLLFVFFLTGNPSFYGDRLFVVMAEQADVNSAAEIDDIVARRTFVYGTLVEHAVSTQEDVRDDLARWGVDYTPYYLVNGLEVEGGPILRLWLESRPDVDRVLYSPILRPAPPEGVDPFTVPEPVEPPWNITMIRADEVWDDFGIRGEGIVIGQSDSGVQWDHPQLISAYRGGEGDHDFNWFDPWYATQQPTDTGGHGTHTLGTVLGTTTGVAPGATWFACANLARNVGSTAYYLDCLQFMLAPFPLEGDPFVDGDASRGANILNNSWGCPQLEGCDAASLLPAVQALRAAGTFIVVSAGNEGPECATVGSPPAIYDEVLSVGAVDSSQSITSFSSRGPVDVDGSNRVKPDLVAPGLEILSAYPEDQYRSWQGTSMAGPHLAGVVALMWSANRQLIGDIETTEQILLETATPLDLSVPRCGLSQNVPNNVTGHGLVNAYAAVERAMALQDN